MTTQPGVSPLSAPVGGVAGIPFTQVDRYTTMRAEYAFVDNDIIVHFFLPIEVLQAALVQHGNRRTEQLDDPATRDQWAVNLVAHDARIGSYWSSSFPAALERVAYEVFCARPPRLVAQYTEELASWYFRALGFCVLKPEELVDRLLSRLDQELDAAGAASLLATKTT